MFIIRVALNELMSFIKKKKNEYILIETKAVVVFLLSLGRPVIPCIFNIYIIIMVIKFNITRFFACCRERRNELRVEGQAQRNGK